MENKSLTVEQWIDGYGVAYTHQQVALEEINRKASLHYQNRGEVKLDEHNLHQLKNWMALEDRHVPPIVLAPDRSGYVVIDGNHRLTAALELGRSKLDAYICAVKPRSELFDSMVLAANTRNGKSLTEQELYELALTSAQLKGYPQAALEHNLQETRLRTYGYRKEGRRRYHEAFGTDAAHLKLSVQQELANTDVENIKALGQEIIDKSKSTDLLPALAAIRKQPAAQQLEHAAAEKKRLQAEAADQGKPKAQGIRRGATVSKLVSQLNTITKTLQRNPTWTTHPSLQEAVAALAKQAKK